ncbi:vWA domain-containing protein [Frondihabitans australicus]|uniref:von Willebrand factor type A domain-containing protein n=1 Tax=Frondihabitans australicus TaxID=386892 RepID=A0A495ICU9_9MICO|nr:VWA domain-containing protein [Frondihabitans australicus]RKR73834.1 von Willebrand factor type A domain-containing protein [Frondihabitans australicus]
MELIFWWMPLAALGAALLGAGLYVLWRRRSTGTASRGTPVAHSERLTALPEYRRVLRRYRTLLGALLVLVIVAASSGVLLASRSASVETVTPQSYKRDIMLCLDVSGSMTDVDAKIVDTFASLASDLHGERIGLTIFDSSAVTVFPLTDDYSYVKSELTTYRDSFRSQGEKGVQYWQGTELGQGASLIGDGLASCVLGFDGDKGSTRPKSIVLATDNYVNGEPLLTLTQSAALATKQNVRVYAIDPVNDQADGTLDSVALDLKTQADSTGGGFYALGDNDTVPSIVQKIDRQEAGLFTGSKRLVVTDHPAPFAIAALLLVLAVLGLLWRVRL